MCFIFKTLFAAECYHQLCISQFHLRPAPPPHPGYRGAFAHLRGWGICKFCTAQGPGICQPPGLSRAFDTHTVSYQNITTQTVGRRWNWLMHYHWFMDLISLPYRVVYNSTQVIYLVMKLIIFATLIIVTIFVDKIDNELKILWLSTFIDTFNLSIDNYRQMLSCIDLSTTFSMIDFDWQVTPWE